MKEYSVSVDITVSKVFFVDANSEEEAKQIVSEKMKRDPWYYASQANAIVDWGIVDVEEEPDSNV